MAYRELALADLDVPIVVITPDYLAEKSYEKTLTHATDSELLAHFTSIFERPFASKDELHAFLEPFLRAEDLIAQIVNPFRLLFDTEWSGSPLEQFRRYSSHSSEHFKGAPQDPRKILELSVFGRFMQMNDAVFRGEKFGGTPLIDAPTSWQYLLWKYEYSATRSGPPHENLRVSNALAFEGRQHGMLSGLPASALIELRRNGASSQIRELLCKGVGAVDSASEDMISTIGKQVIENIDNAFAEHERELKALSSSRKKFYGIDVSRYLVAGTLQLAAQSHPKLSELAAIAALAGVPDPKDMWRRFRELNSQSTALKRSPTGIMFKHLKKNFAFPT